ncbi:MAG TPA: phage protease [Candidatus Binataceae bacterium]|nr:phage protease [Candidatus Binataceae bacterium]
MSEMIGVMDSGASKDHGADLAVVGTKLTGSATPPAWIELIPAGEFKGRDGRGPFRLTNPGRVIAATRALQMNAGLPIDYDHATDFGAPEGRPAPAAGWICGFEEREGALWGKVEWTAHGADAVATREYRYISPVFEYAEDGEVVRLLRAALTNNPNLFLTAIAARSGIHSEPSEQGTPRAGQEDSEYMDAFVSEVRKLLGLSDESTPEKLLAVVAELVKEAQRRKAQADDGPGGLTPETAYSARAEGDPARYVPVAKFEEVLTELNRLQAARGREQAEKAVDNAMRDGRLSPAQREWATSYCHADPSGFARFIANQSPLLTIAVAGRASGAESLAGQFNQRCEETAVNQRAAAGLTPVEGAICTRLGIKPREYVTRKTGARDFLEFA